MTTLISLVLLQVALAATPPSPVPARNHPVSFMPGVDEVIWRSLKQQGRTPENALSLPPLLQKELARDFRAAGIGVLNLAAPLRNCIVNGREIQGALHCNDDDARRLYEAIQKTENQDPRAGVGFKVRPMFEGTESEPFVGINADITGARLTSFSCASSQGGRFHQCTMKRAKPH